jgi:hypothetical protein
MRRLTCICALALLAAACLPAAAQAAFGLNNFDLTFTDEDGTPATQAGSHPFAMTTAFATNLDSEDFIEGQIRDFFLTQVPGFVADTTAYEPCSTLQFLEQACPPESVVGITANSTSELGLWSVSPVYNVTPPPGVLLRLGFRAADSVNIVVDGALSTTYPNLPVAAARNTPQMVPLLANKTQLWGDPSDPGHEELRGPCGEYQVKFPSLDVAAFQFESQGAKCPLTPREKPFLTLPTNCSGALATSYEALSWAGDEDSGLRLTHDAAGNPQPFSGCDALGFKPEVSAQPTSLAAESPTGLDFSLDIDDPGLTKVGVETAQSQIKRTVVTLPEGMTANPSVAEGLEVCSEDDLDNETLGSQAGQGCPQAAKIGTIEVRSPLIDQPVSGSLYQAEPHANHAADALIAFYIVLRNTELGVLVKQTVRVDPTATGRLLATTVEDIPQVPFSSFRLRFKEGGRNPLVSPPSCGTHAVETQLVPWSGGPTVSDTSTFEIISGPAGGPCPPGAQPFEPGFEAGSQNNAAGRYSPFAMRLTRRDGDQDLTRFDATLPPGVLARLAGVSRCSDARIARADARSGKAELAAPSCPPGSRIGAVLTGAGVGSQLTYVPGTIYLAGPFAGAPLSAVAIVPAVAGPFDVGTVVVRQALRVDPVTGVVSADGARSDPIPHILAGIPLRVRDIQVRIERPEFTINPTSCDPMATVASIWGGGADAFSILDDSPVAREDRYQAADCARLGFAPRLGLRLKGGTGRGANPALRAVLRPQSGDANLKRTVVRLPRSAFLDQAHIRTVCTRVQFAAEACPKGSIYGRARAFTPLLEDPLEGPAYLRSSNNELPDLVFDLHGIVDIEAAARIDSIGGGIRATFPRIPDAPLSKVVVRMQGGQKGLIVNARDLCAAKNRADVRLDAHSAKRRALRPVLRPQCAKRKGRG